jgi:hypothetical protein
MPEIKQGNGITLTHDSETNELTVQTELQGATRKNAINLAATGVLESGAALTGTIDTLTDPSKNWVNDEWANHAVQIHRDGHADCEYAIIESNSDDTLFLDADTFSTIEAGNTYEIIETLALTPEQIPAIIALDIRIAPLAVILPESTEAIERLETHIYIERANDGTQESPILCRGSETILGAKYAELKNIYEGATIAAHTWNVPHWDVLSVEGVSRLAAGFWSDAESVDQTEYAPVGATASLEYDFLKRFIVVERDGINWLRYTSLIPQTFAIRFTPTVTKTGGVGELFVTIAKRDPDTEEVTYLSSRESSTRFGSGEGSTSITVEVPVLLTRGDEIAAAAYKTAAIFSIDAGSTIKAEVL